MTTTDEQIRAAAYLLWEKAGRPEGEHLQHWQQALSAMTEKQAAKPKKRTSAATGTRRSSAKAA